MFSLWVLSLLQCLGVEKTSLPGAPHTLSLPVLSQAGARLDHSTPALNGTHAPSIHTTGQNQTGFNTGLMNSPTVGTQKEVVILAWGMEESFISRKR